MRTTLTLEDDVAARLEQTVRRRKQSFKAVVNEALRAGLAQLDHQGTPRPFQTAGFDLGPIVIGNVDDVEGVLSRIEGDDHR